MDEFLSRDIDAFIEAHEKEIFADIARLVAIDSVKGEPAPGAPFGEGPAKALAEGLKIAQELGLKAVNCEDHIGYAQIGEGEDYLATITHLDVVPVGDGWTEDPFTMREREGYIIGRGVLDDKGPSVLCLYALKYLKEKQVPAVKQAANRSIPKAEATQLPYVNESRIQTAGTNQDIDRKNLQIPGLCIRESNHPMLHTRE